MCRAGLSKLYPYMSSMTILWDRPMPRVSRPPRRERRGHRLLGQHSRMARVSGHHRCAELDARHAAAGHGQRRQRVQPEDVGDPGGREPVVGCPLQLVTERVKHLR